MHKPDVGGVFATDDHRRVLGHLTAPGDEMLWTSQELYVRMLPDVGSALSESEVGEILLDLQADGSADCHPETQVWQMTAAGLERLTGAVSDTGEPGPVIINEGV